MEAQVENAVLVAFDPYSPQALKSQAFDFLNQLRANSQGWPTCLGLALRSTPKAQEVVRHACLEVVINAIASNTVDEQGMGYVKENMMAYVRKAYWQGEIEADTYAIENKLVQLLTFLFVRTYQVQWPTFVEDLLGLCGPGPAQGAPHRAVRLYLRTLGSIHDEIGDNLVIRSGESQGRANDLKDLLRDRDVDRIARSWMEMLPVWHGAGREIFNECLSVIGKWASWIDLSLIINEGFLQILVSSIMAAADTDAAEEATPAVNAMLEILSKKMKDPADKLNLLNIFRVQEIVAQISNSPRLQDRASSDYDTDLAELAARIVNAVMLELVVTADSPGVTPEVSARVNEQIKVLLPYLLRYFSDEFDEVCSTVIPALTDLLAFARKRTDQAAEWIPVLPAVLQAVISKMKYDDTSDWASNDSGTEEAEFQELRKRLETLQQTIAAIDEATCIQIVSSVVNNAFDSYQGNQGSINWRHLDLALHEMFIFGQAAQRNGALYTKNKPVTPAAEALINMLIKMTQSGISNFPHPAIQLQYMELCVRYHAFFDNNPQFIPQALDNFARFIHHDHVKVRQRSWYLFYRFTRLLKPHVSTVAGTIIQSIGPLLTIRAELPKDSDDDDDGSDSNEQGTDAKFQSQLYLYEAVGSIASAGGVQLQDQIMFVKAVAEPQFADLSSELPKAKTGDERAVLQIHHIIAALGTLAHGFVDSTPSAVRKSTPIAPELSAEFVKVAEAMLTALDSLNSFIQIRDAARNAFARLLGVLGTNILPQLTRWLGGLLVPTSSKDEIAAFLRLLGQVIYAFSTEIQSFLNDIFSTLVQRVFAGISEPTSGTDEEIQLVELKTHYLSFLLVILNSGLGSVLVSAENQGQFETVISSIEHFTKNSEDLLTAKIAFQTLTKFCDVWGGPEVPVQDTSAQPNPSLPGFDRFMQERFSRLAWALPSEPSFDPKDAKSRQVLQEAAGMQKQILSKTGAQYLEWLRSQELAGLGMNQGTIDEYIGNLAASDVKTWKAYFVKLTQSIKQ